MWEMVNAVSRGECSSAFAQHQPETLNHSRRLTTANSVLRLYVSTSEASEKLNTLTTYIIRAYAPMWFIIKTKPSFNLQATKGEVVSTPTAFSISHFLHLE